MTDSVPTVLDRRARDAAEGVLVTTRSFRRRLDLDRPVDLDEVRACIDVAVHAPSAENQQNWRWLVIADAERRARIAELYRQAFVLHRAVVGRTRRRRDQADRLRIVDSVRWLADHLHEVPVMVIPCALGRPPQPGNWGNRARPDLDHLANVMFYGSAFPAVWSLQVALRARGLGSVLTCTHLAFEAEVATLLGIPRRVTQLCLLPVAHITGADVRPAARIPADSLIGVDRWSDQL